jgi:23S rRNA (uracil1939-C5)-methyltransferase
MTAGDRGSVIEIVIDSLAAGGDGVGRDASGRVTFVPQTAPGDRARVRIVQAKSRFARAELVEVVEPGASRIAPVCPEAARGCGGCAWQHVARDAQVAAKHAIVTSALRDLPQLAIHPIAAPAPSLGWRRRARFHVEDRRVGLYARGSHRVLPIAHCPQLEPALEAALIETVAAGPPDGELALAIAHDGRVVVGTERAWPGAATLIGRARIVGGLAAGIPFGECVVELEPDLWGGPWAFAQASAAGNAALIACVRAAVGEPRGRLLELYAGAGNFTRGLVADGWDMVATDIVEPARPVPGAVFRTASTSEILQWCSVPVDVIVLDPPRTGAPEAIDGIVRAAPRVVVYVSCDAATLARDARRLVDGGYRATDAWPFDVMPQTSHVEVVLRLSSVIS